MSGARDERHPAALPAVCTRQAAQRYGIDWAILAGIGKVECDHGRDPDPSCTREGATNSAGAGGPMQFLASDLGQYGVDGRRHGAPDRWDPADAIYGAARYLRASGAPAHPARSSPTTMPGWYVAEVEHWAARLPRARPGQRRRRPRRPPLAAGARPARGHVLSPDDGHVALGPPARPPPSQAMIAAGNALQDLPYGPAGHPDPVGAPERGLLEHRQLRALPRGRASIWPRSCATTRSLRTTPPRACGADSPIQAALEDASPLGDGHGRPPRRRRRARRARAAG